MICDKPCCMRRREELGLWRERQRVDGVVERLYRCGVCDGICKTLEFPESELKVRSDAVRSEILQAEQRAQKKGGMRLFDRCIGVLKATLGQLEQERATMHNRLGCDPAVRAYDGEVEVKGVLDRPPAD